MSLADECVKTILDAPDYSRFSCDIRATYDDMIALAGDDNEVEMVCQLECMVSEWLENHWGTIEHKCCGFEHWSSKIGTHMVTNSTGKEFKQTCYTGDDTKPHVHLRYILKTDRQWIINAITNNSLMDATKRDRVKFWNDVRRTHIFTDAWDNTDKAWRFFQLGTEFKEPELWWLTYPIKMCNHHFLKRQKNYKQIFRSLCSLSDNVWEREYDKRIDRFDTMVEIDQKKKSSLLAKDTVSWETKLADWVSQQCGDNISEGNICRLVLEYHKDKGRPFTKWDIVKNVNLFLTMYNKDFEQKFIQCCLSELK